MISRSIDDHRGVGGGLTWVLSSHDVPRYPSRLALPAGIHPDSWLASNGTSPRIDDQQARGRGRAASLLMLALPGSAYLFQGEELGLPEVVDVPLNSPQQVLISSRPLTGAVVPPETTVWLAPPAPG